MKKFLNIVTKILFVLSILGAFALQYFSAHKMGMARHMYYMNQKLSAVIALDTFETVIAVSSLVIFAIALIIAILKRSKIKLIDKALFAIISIILANELLFMNVKYTVAFYFILILFLIALFLQSIYLIFCGLSKEKINEKEL